MQDMQFLEHKPYKSAVSTIARVSVFLLGKDGARKTRGKRNFEKFFDRKQKRQKKSCSKSNSFFWNEFLYKLVVLVFFKT